MLRLHVCGCFFSRRFAVVETVLWGVGKMMAFGPAAIVQSIYAEPDCGGAPTRTAQFLAYVCQDTPQGSEMVVRRTVMSRFQIRCQQ